MGQKVLIVGESGTGKSTSLRNFAKDEVCLIKVINKQLPFRGKFEETYVTDKSSEIIRKMKSTDKKVIVIDDGQYTMGNEFFRRALEKGYDKFSDIGKNFFDILSATDDLPEDVIVYILLHTIKDENGNIKIKTIGKMLDEKLTVEGTSTIVLMTQIVDGTYSFQTQNSGKDVCKSPIGMFSNYLIDNDLKMVDGIIREYYELSDEIVEEKGVAAEKPTRTRRGQTPTEEPVKRERRERKPVEEPTPVESQPVVEEVDIVDELDSIDAQALAEEEAVEILNQIAGEVYEPTNDTIPPIQEELPKRRQRIVETADDKPTNVETTVIRRERKTIAEKMAEGGFATEEQPTVVRRSRIRN